MVSSLLSSVTTFPLHRGVWRGVQGPGGIGAGSGREERVGSTRPSAGASGAKRNGALLVGHSSFS